MAKLYSVNLYKRVVDYDGSVEEFIEGRIVVKRRIFTVKDIFERKRYHIVNDSNENYDYERISGSDYSNYDMAEDTIFSEFEYYCGYVSEEQDYEAYFVKKSELNPTNELDKDDIENLIDFNSPKELLKAFPKAKRKQYK